MNLELTIALLTIAIPFDTTPMQDKPYTTTTNYQEGIIFVGDSRTVGMESIANCEKNEFFVGKVGAGYEWFVNEAKNDIEEIITKHTYNNWNIVLCLGINDLHNVKKYQDCYSALSTNEWAEYDIHYLSVNPVDESICNNITNQEIIDFNSYFINEPLYIDSYSEIINTYEAPDGIHYSYNTYTKLYNYIKNDISY